MYEESLEKLAKDLVAVVDLARDAAQTVQEESRRQSEWPAEERAVGLPSRTLYQAQQTLLAVSGKITELVTEPQNRLQEVSSQYFESRALHICAEHRVPDLLSEAGSAGLSVEAIGNKIGIEPLKLCMT